MTTATVEGVEVDTRHWIGGERVKSESIFTDISPIDEQPIAEVSAGSEPEVDAAVEAAQQAFPGWVATPPAEWEAVQRRELDAPAWIADSQADDMLPDWLHAADAVVFVDASPLRCLWRVARRRRNRRASVGVPAETEPGPVHHALLKFVRNQWRYRRHARGDLLAELAREREDRRVVIVRSRQDAAAFVDSL